MNLLVNGKATQLPAGSTVAGLIVELRLGGKRLAVEHNGELVPRSLHAETPLREGDQVEIVQAIGGG